MVLVPDDRRHREIAEILRHKLDDIGVRRDRSVLSVTDINRYSSTVLEYALDFSEDRHEPCDILRVFPVISVQVVWGLVVPVMPEIDVVRRGGNDEIDGVCGKLFE